ncbi:MAG: response regulator transcription factor [Ignavibacteriales bacterium]|jgi:two-component system alkaline phosphatase synthesis response regulator PhoP|nr:response regulator transcription factor [Ignavibacteriaceae bacterium]NLH60435.1 response regulator transcription factor [Ignavibacteriales bacterium]HOJ19382.1 response regulator transcription factor [Ignavibacteriaceae bacterium]HPO55329.1 response regulator transcription factor [Ignavibacteriaceae bacterium]
MSLKILLVDDEKDIVEFLRYNLEREGFEVICAYNGQIALDKLVEKPDLIMLDVMMPRMDGFEVCRRIREKPEFRSTPIVFLTARSSEVDEIKALNDLGANDYIIKPVTQNRLIARVRANLRTAGVDPEGGREGPVNIKTGPLEIDRGKYVVLIDGIEISFPKKEFELLYFLANNPNTVHKRETLLANIWGSEVYVGDRTVDVHIRKIREKLEEYADLIETIKGVGYRFRDG